LNILGVILFSNLFFEKFYTKKKYDEIKEYAKEINQHFADEPVGSVDFRRDLIYKFDKLERNNIEIIWFVYDKPSSHADIGYATKITGRYLPGEPLDIERTKEYIGQLIAKGDLESIKELYTFKTYDVEDEENPSISLVSLVYQTQIEDSQESLRSYIVFSSPKEYIGTLAKTASSFVVYLSLSTLLIAVLLIVIVSWRITKPIEDINHVANKIATMDFSESCVIKSNDEIGTLAKSINEMRIKLQENIGYMEQRTQMLSSNLAEQELSNKTKKEFIASVSHDFKTPLSLILAYCELLEENCPDEQSKKQLLIISDQAVKMNLMVNQLLTLSQLESGTVTIDETIFSINEVVEEVVKDFKIILEKAEIKLTFNYKDQYIVQGDYNKIIQVMTNLLENAVKYCDNKKIININLSEIRNKIRVSIYNTHPGLDDEVYNKIFDSFYKEDKSRQERDNSYGLGLSIVKAIMDMHKQNYGVYKANAGIVFWFELEKFDE